MADSYASSLEEVNRRFKAARINTGMNQTEFAKMVDRSPQQISSYEGAGSKPIKPPIDGVCTFLRKKYGITLDWIFLGQGGDMDDKLVTKLMRIEREFSEQGKS